MADPTPPTSRTAARHKTPVELIMEHLKWTPIPEAQPHGDLPVATHEATLRIGDLSLRCYQLSDGRRVLAAEDVHAFFAGFGDGEWAVPTEDREND